MEWRREEIFQIIALYRQFPCLWDYQNPYYKRVDKKKSAWEEIAKNMDKDEESVKKKIKHLRSAYLVEKKKVDSSRMKSDDVYKPHLFYYEELNFLHPIISIKQNKSDLKLSTEESELAKFSPQSDPLEDMPLDDSQDSCPLSQSCDMPVVHKTFVHTKKRKKVERDEKIDCICCVDAIIKQNNNSVTNGKETMFSSFGKSIGMQLEIMPLNSAMEVMAEIQQLLTIKMRTCFTSKTSKICENCHK